MSKQLKPSRARAEINELAAAMHKSGTLDTTFEKITMRGRNHDEETHIIRLSGEGQRRFAELLLDPPEPSPALLKAVQQHRQLTYSYDGTLGHDTIRP